jgi:hypothetical protein
MSLEIKNRQPGQDMPTMPDPSRDAPDSGSHLPTMPDPVNDADRGQELPTDPDPVIKPPRIDDPVPLQQEERTGDDISEKVA